MLAGTPWYRRATKIADAMIPFIDLHPVSQLVADAVLPRWASALSRCEFVGGAAVQEFERELAGHCGTREAVTCGNGTDALRLALQAAGVGPGTHVALPNLTFWATFEAIVQLGAIPILVDISPDDLQLDLDELRRAHDAHRFRHAVLVHLYGWASAQLSEIRTFCASREICLVEDAAQALGAQVGGRPVLADAAVASLSFYPAKVLGGCMDGGAVVTGDAALSATVRSLANHGRTAHYAHEQVGWNSRMSALAAHYLREVLRHADEIVDARRALGARYRARWADAAPAARLRGPGAGVRDNGYLVVLECQHSAERYVAGFEQRGIAVRRTYPETLADQAGARGRFVATGELAQSRAFVQRVLNLPLYFGMAERDVDTVVEAARDLVR